MGHKKARKRKQAAAQQDADGEQGKPGVASNSHGQDPARALIAVSRNGDFIAAACGNSIQVFGQRENGAIELSESEQQHPIRALTFDSGGKYLLAAGDDKAVRVWKCDGWSLILRVVATKRISAADFTADSEHVVLADKFGDVLIASVPQTELASGELRDTKPSFLLGHFSSIVTALVPSGNKRWLASTDREGKARISILPSNPEQGAPCIQSFCLGHTSFLTAAAFLDSGRLVTGSGDGTVRLWSAREGRQLDAFDTAAYTKARLGGPGIKDLPATSATEHAAVPTSSAGEARGGGGINAAESAEQRQPRSIRDEAAEECSGAEGEDGDGEGELRRWLEDLPPAVLAVVALEDRHLVVAAVEGEDELFLLAAAEDRLELKGRLAVPGTRLPNSIGASAGGCLWAAGGCHELVPFTVGSVNIPTTEPETKGDECNLAAVRSSLGALSAEDVPADIDNSGLQVSQELRKWVYSHEEISRRKRNRADLRDQT